MKNLFFLFIFSTILFAKSHLISPITVPKTTILNITSEKCNELCLKRHLDRGEIFSFLARSNEKNKNASLHQELLIYKSLFNIEQERNTNLSIALLIPDKSIGRYATQISDTIFSYLLAKNRHFELQNFYIEDETKESLKKALEKIQIKGFKYVIAPLTNDGVQRALDIRSNLLIYFPTINIKNIKNVNPDSNWFGGIDYDAQIAKLVKKIRTKVSIFYDDGALGRTLNEKVEKKLTRKSIILKQSISNRTSNLKKVLRRNRKLKNTTAILNTPIVKSGLVMSQLTLYDIKSDRILSTQINYDPLLLSITQYNDRKHMLIANSIQNNNDYISEINYLLNNNIEYDWINFSSTLGIDYFYNRITGEPREFANINMKKNQMDYPIELKRATYSRFVNTK